ncbi:MAG: hypothetical protein EON58_01830 [Alphaproteobacteria bacterium]|nr:MAG: hypothetical protein EON58_01830 [Alphaproteobacteria bacterium]
MTVSAGVYAYITEQRELLARLERFAGTSEYRFLLAAIEPMAVENPEPWLSEWLIHPAPGLGGLPIDAVALPGGVDRVQQHLLWMTTFVVS